MIQGKEEEGEKRRRTLSQFGSEPNFSLLHRLSVTVQTVQMYKLNHAFNSLGKQTRITPSNKGFSNNHDARH